MRVKRSLKKLLADIQGVGLLTEITNEDIDVYLVSKKGGENTSRFKRRALVDLLVLARERIAKSSEPNPA